MHAEQPVKNASKEMGARSHALTDDSNEGTDTEESSDMAANNGQTAYVVDHKGWDELDVSPELKEMFQYILRYAYLIVFFCSRCADILMTFELFYIQVLTIQSAH